VTREGHILETSGDPCNIIGTRLGGIFAERYKLTFLPITVETTDRWSSAVSVDCQKHELSFELFD
jgi:hypothetical protein